MSECPLILTVSIWLYRSIKWFKVTMKSNVLKKLLTKQNLFVDPC